MKYYAAMLIERVEYAVNTVEELLSTLTSDQRWGVIVEFEEISPSTFAQLVTDAPEWVEWME